MALFNILIVNLTCPHCQSNVEMECEFRFGSANLDRYELGERIRWNGRNIYAQTPDGNMIGEGYVVCPICSKDFWTKISVVNDILKDVEIDVGRKGYILY